jgi:hypothetical protein
LKDTTICHLKESHFKSTDIKNKIENRKLYVMQAQLTRKLVLLY